MILQVHDELIVEAPDDEVTTIVPLMGEVMEGAFELDAPLKVDFRKGQNWEEMKPLGGGG
jgi:DNA polymerase-1